MGGTAEKNWIASDMSSVDETHAMTEHEQWNPLWFHPFPVWILAVSGLDFGVIDGGKSLPDARRDMPIVQLHMINVEELMRLGLE